MKHFLLIELLRTYPDRNTGISTYVYTVAGKQQAINAYLDYINDKTLCMFEGNVLYFTKSDMGIVSTLVLTHHENNEVTLRKGVPCE